MHQKAIAELWVVKEKVNSQWERKHIDNLMATASEALNLKTAADINDAVLALV